MRPSPDPNPSTSPSITHAHCASCFTPVNKPRHVPVFALTPQVLISKPITMASDTESPTVAAEPMELSTPFKEAQTEAEAEAEAEAGTADVCPILS